MRTSAHFGEKLRIYEIYGVYVRTGGWASSDNLRTRGQFFVILCGRFLWTTI